MAHVTRAPTAVAHGSAPFGGACKATSALAHWNRTARLWIEATAKKDADAKAKADDKAKTKDDAEVVLFERREGRWIVAEPAGISSPGDVVDAVLESLTGLPVIDVVADGVEHEGQFGLAPPKVRLRLESAGEVVANVVLGGLNPTRTAVYAKKAGKDEVVLLGLNPKYYVDLVFENVRRQQASAGVAASDEGGGRRGVPPPAPSPGPGEP